LLGKAMMALHNKVPQTQVAVAVRALQVLG
jgi:hypothetical protein